MMPAEMLTAMRLHGLPAGAGTLSAGNT